MIELRDVSLSFGERVVFDHFTAKIPLDSITAVRGPSGKGKTTLFRLLLGLQKPDGGTISGMEGKKASVVFQEDRLLPWVSALENVALVSERAAAETALAALGLKDSLHLLPKELSGGMCRRVAIARALAYGGDVLFLDEPFTGLDEDNKRLVANEVKRANVPVFVITHEDSERELFGECFEIML